MEQRDHADQREGGPSYETLGSNTLFLLCCTVGKQVEERRDEIISWLEDTSEGGGADLLAPFVRKDMQDVRDISIQLEDLRRADSVFMPVFCRLVEKFDFDYVTYNVEQSTREEQSSSLREFLYNATWVQSYVCAREGESIEPYDICDEEGCPPLHLPRGTALRREQLGGHLRFLMSSPLTEQEMRALRIMITSRYIWHILPGRISSRGTVTDELWTCWDWSLETKDFLVGKR